jgi:C-terminal processing protease CtpA/Prc
VYISAICNFFFITPCQSAIQEQQRPQDSQQMLYKRRLLELAGVWNAAKYLHPSFVHQHSYQYWDSVIVRILPRMKSGISEQEYIVVLTSVLDALHDKYSYLHDTSRSLLPELSSTTPFNSVLLTADSSLILTVSDMFAFLPSRLARDSSFVQRIALLSSAARRVVLDLRQQNRTVQTPKYLDSISIAAQELMYQVWGTSFPLPQQAYRIHKGYCEQPQTKNKSPYSSSVSIDVRVIPQRTAIINAALPTVIIINEGCRGVEHILYTLQRYGKYVVVHEGTYISGIDGKQYCFPSITGKQVCIRTTEYVDNSTAMATQMRWSPDSVFLSDARAKQDSSHAIRLAIQQLHIKNALQRSTKYDSTARFSQYVPEETFIRPCATREERLLGVFQFWGVIHYFFPYKHLMDTPWDTVFVNRISAVERCTTEEEYRESVRAMMIRLQDSHAQMNQIVPENYFPFRTRAIEGNVVVEQFIDSLAALQSSIRIGDVIHSMNGQPVSQLLAQQRKELAASTEQAFLNHAVKRLLAGAPRTTAKIELSRDTSLALFTVPIQYSIPFQEFMEKSRLKRTPSARLISPEIGYINVCELEQREVDSVFTALYLTKGVILDIRGYPRGTMNQIASYLLPSGQPLAQFKKPCLDGLHLENADLWTQKSTHAKFLQQGWARKKLVVLIDERTLSQAEHTCLFVERAMPTFVGSPTNGTNGDVTGTVLPGKIHVWFSGQEVRHADGRQLQRIGIQPHVRVEPTLAGIRAGRDEVLEKGIEVLKSLIK